VQLLLALLSGAVVSFLLGLFGGGGSMLALPLLVHLVDMSARTNALRPLFAVFVIAAGLYVAADGARIFV
jgi:uncharacterized membrane protein YfcA